MYTLLNKKRYGIASYFAAFFMVLFTPLVMAIHQVGEGGGSNEEADKKALLDTIKSEVAALLKDQMKDVVTREEIEGKVKSINDKCEKLVGNDAANTELKQQFDELATKYNQLETASKEQGTELAKLKNQPTEAPVRMGFIEAAKQAILTHKKKDDMLKEVTDIHGTRLSLVDYLKDNKRTPEIEIKDGTGIIRKFDMLESAYVNNYVTQTRLTELVPGVYGVPVTLFAHVLDYMPIRNINRPVLAMMVNYSYSDGSGTKTEGSAGTASYFSLKTVNFPSFYIDTYIPISDETLDDVDEVLSELNRVAPDRVKSALDAKIYADAGNDSTDIQGMFYNGTKCTDFDTTDYANTIVGANMVDLIECMVAECEASNYTPDTVGLNPTDVRIYFNALKNQLDDSVKDNRLVFVGGQLVSVCGLRVARSPKITTNTCFVGAIKQVALLGVRKAMTMEIGLNGDDFKERQKTVRVGMRVAFGVGDPLGIIYSDDMTTDRDAIKLVPAA